MHQEVAHSGRLGFDYHSSDVEVAFARVRLLLQRVGEACEPLEHGVGVESASQEDGMTDG